MRKALLVFALVAFLATGTVFAEITGVGEPTVTGSVTMQFGYDLDTEASGFYNDSSLTVTLPLISGDETKGGDDGMYGEITVEDLAVDLRDDGFYDVSEDDTFDATGLTASISAKLVLGSLFVGLGNPDFEMNNVDVEDYDIDAHAFEDETNTWSHGASVGFENELVSVEFKIGSYNDGFYDPTDDDNDAEDTYESPFDDDIADDEDETYIANLNNSYVFGADITLTPAEGISIPVSFFYDADWGTDGLMGVGAAVSVAMAPLTLDIPVDYVKAGDESGLEVMPSLAYCLTEAGGSNVALSVLYGSYTDVVVQDDISVSPTNAIMDVTLTLTETEELGFVDALAATVEVGLTDVMDYADASADMGWDVDADLSYNVDGLKPYVNFGYGSDEVFDMGVGAILGAAFTGLDNTTVTLDYTNEALTESKDADPTESGRVTVDVTVAF